MSGFVVAHDLTQLVDLVDQLVAPFTERVQLDDGTYVSGRLPALIDMLNDDAAFASASTGSSSGFESQVPVYSPAHDALMLLDEESADLSYLLGLPPARLVKERLRRLVGAAAAVDDKLFIQVVVTLAARVASIREVLGLDLPPLRLRSVKCPYCGEASVFAGRREVRAWCTTQDCVDPDGQRYVWVGEAGLHWLGAAQQVSA